MELVLITKHLIIIFHIIFSLLLETFATLNHTKVIYWPLKALRAYKMSLENMNFSGFNTNNMDIWSEVGQHKELLINSITQGCENTVVSRHIQ